MAKTVRFMFRLTGQEFELLRNRARWNNSPSIAGFIRSRVLEKDLWLEKKVQETYVMVKSIRDSLKKS